MEKAIVKNPGIFWFTRVAFLSFGSYLLFGAYSAWSNNQWPSFMPPQLDILGLFFDSISAGIGIYLEIALLLFLGMFFVVAGLLPKKNK